MAMDLQQRPAQHGHRRDHTRCETENSRVSSTAEPHEKWGDYLSFQHPDKIADAIRCVTDTKLWEAVAANIGNDAKYVKERLTLIVDRRNKIAHEADLDPTFGTLWAIHSNDVLGVIDFLDDVAKAIFDVVGA